MVPKEAKDRQQEPKGEGTDDEAADDVPARGPVGGALGVTAVNVPGREGDGVEAAQDGRDEECEEGRVVAPPDALRGCSQVSGEGPMTVLALEAHVVEESALRVNKV